jgi:hypothetical protein
MESDTLELVWLFVDPHIIAAPLEENIEVRY